jgi:hypothetical protein
MPRNPWSARGLPLVRQSAPGARAGESSARPADAVAGLPGIVRECLLRPPQPDTLHVARAGARAGRQLQRARTTHRLEPWEELIAVWQWTRVLGLIAAARSSLIFTSQDIRIAEPRLRLSISYDAFREHTFSYEFTPGGRTGPDVCELVITGPTSWRSPNADQSAELIAADLTRIRELTSPAR